MQEFFLVFRARCITRQWHKIFTPSFNLDLIGLSVSSKYLWLCIKWTKTQDQNWPLCYSLIQWLGLVQSSGLAITHANHSCCECCKYWILIPRWNPIMQVVWSQFQSNFLSCVLLLANVFLTFHRRWMRSTTSCLRCYFPLRCHHAA